MNYIFIITVTIMAGIIIGVIAYALNHEETHHKLSNALRSCDPKEFKSDKVEPKFHEGDWAVSNLDKKARQISEVHFDEYNSYYVVNGKSVNLEEYDRLHHLWTIQDAKAGDVLICKGNIKNSNGIKYKRICLFNNLDKAFFTLTKTSDAEVCDIDVNIDYPDNTVPATKEQKEILFMAMADARYEWDDEKKELKKIIDKEQIKKNLQDNSFRRMFEQNPAEWSEEDESMYTRCIGILGKCYMGELPTKVEEELNWLKSLKDKILIKSNG